MEKRRRLLGPATVRWSDYVGTAAADDADAVLDSPSLYTLAQIDRERWTIVGVDLAVAPEAAATVYAVDRVAHQVDTLAEIENLGWNTGELPVVAFEVPAEQARDFASRAFKRLSIRMVARDLRDQMLAVEPAPDL